MLPLDGIAERTARIDVGRNAMTGLENGPIGGQLNKFDLSAEQQDTAGLLERLLGKAVSDRYIDFCRLSAGAFDIRVSSPIAGHSLRELDSILRQTLGVPLQAVSATTEGEDARMATAAHVLRGMGYGEDDVERAIDSLKPRVSHKDQIRKIVAQLGLAGDGDIANAWIAVSSAHKKAHERLFNRALRVDDEFREKWADPFHVVIRSIAVALQSRYTSLTERVEELAQMPDKARAISLFQKEISGALPLQWHFFQNIRGPTWLPALLNRGFIAEPPYKAEETQGTGMRQWPVGRYLVEIAKSDDAAARSLVVFCLRQVATSKHPDVRRDGLEIISILPPDEAARASDLVPGWLTEGDYFFGVQFVEQILKKLTEAGDRPACLTVARSLYQLFDHESRPSMLFSSHMYGIAKVWAIDAG